MKFTTTLIIFSFVGQFLFAQDIIILNTGEEFDAKVTEIGLDIVKYKKWNNQNGPVYSALKSDIFKITYQNGEYEVFKTMDPNEHTTGPYQSTKKDKDITTTSEAPTRNSNKSKLIKAPKDKALVFIVRPELIGGAVPMKLYVNDIEFGKNTGGKYMYGFFDSGAYSFMSKAENKFEVKLTIKAGKTYFLKQKVKMGIFKPRTSLILLNETQGKADLEICKLSKNQGAPYFEN